MQSTEFCVAHSQSYRSRIAISVYSNDAKRDTWVARSCILRLGTSSNELWTRGPLSMCKNRHGGHETGDTYLLDMEQR